MTTCRVVTCDRVAGSRTALCRAHRRRELKGLPVEVVLRQNLSSDTLEDRFWNMVVITDHGAEWGGSRDTAGYGRLTHRGQFWLAHRAAWTLFRGPIPDGMQIDHSLECPASCVTVAHLSMHTISEHTSLGWERGELAGWNAERKVADRPEGIAPVYSRPRVGRVVHDG